MTRARLILTVLVVLLLSLVAGIAWAGSSNSTAVDWSVLSGGGAPAESVSGVVALNGTLGQTAIGHFSDSHTTLGAGYWYGLGKEDNWIYLPIIVRNY